MSDKKYVGVAWFATMLGAVGLVLARNERGQDRAYIGPVQGESQEADIKFLLEWGAKVQDTDAVKALIIANGGAEPVDACEHKWIHMKGRALFDDEVKALDLMYCVQCHETKHPDPDDPNWSTDEILAQFGHKP